MIHFLKEDDFPFCFRVRRLVPSRYFLVFGLIHILRLGLGCGAQGSMSPPRPRELQPNPNLLSTPKHVKLKATGYKSASAEAE